MCSFTGLGKEVNEAIREAEKNVCVILPEALKKPIVAKNRCKQVARQIKDAYFDGKPFNSSVQSFVYVSIQVLRLVPSLDETRNILLKYCHRVVIMAKSTQNHGIYDYTTVSNKLPEHAL